MMAAGQIAVQIAIVLSVLFLGFFVLVRPQLRRINAHKQFMSSLVIGDRILMRGGLIGYIVALGETNEVSLSLNDSITVTIDKNSIDRRL
jgi:preprotein translocase subunit YajC